MPEPLTGRADETRLLRLTTPLGVDTFIVECLRGEEGVSLGYRLELDVLSTDAGIALKSLLGQPALLALDTALAGGPRYFHGHVTEAAILGADGGLARYGLTIAPWYSFLRHGRDSRVFQDQTVLDILSALFAGWQGVGKLVPDWRFDVRDASVYPRRSLTCQYQESNADFAERLMREEGLFHYFEHHGDADSATLGRHVMVIADHNGSFQPNPQPLLQFSQPGAVMREDTVDRWRTEARWIPQALEMTSWDYRGMGRRPVAATGDGGGTLPLASRDTPGAYAYASREQGQRIADRQRQAMEVERETHVGAGTVRTLAAGTTFTLSGQAQLDMASDDGARTFVALRVRHLAHNNLQAGVRRQVAGALGPGALAQAIGQEQVDSLHATGAAQGERPLYRNRIDALRSDVPYRSADADGHGRLLHPKPTVRGQHSAIVVGPPGAVTHTDRDHRIKVQFHWQRGEHSHSRLNHPVPDGHSGAPGDDRAGTWVRVAATLAPTAGANWGAVAVPRVGSEVLVDFIDGNIDRPVVIASLYNGAGQEDGQHNRVAAGAGAATGNAPAWFAGVAGGHAHAAVLSGLKSQAMSASQGGAGAYSQLVFDDSPGEPRVALQRHAGAHQGTDELNLGHLRHQTDNQRLATAGFGAELKTAHGAALRAGRGMLLSADARGGAGGQQLDAREAQSQIEQSQQLQASLATAAQAQLAMLKTAQDAAEPLPAALPAIAQMAASARVLAASATAASAGDGGGAGAVPAFSAAALQLSAPSGMALLTPASAVLAAGGSSALTAGQAINFASQANALHSVRGGVSLFSYGKAAGAASPNQETGLRLHAASGKFSSQSQAGATRLTADQAITVASTSRAVKVLARDHVRLTAQGAWIKLAGGNIEVHGPGTMSFKASMKELAGPMSSAPTLPELPNEKLYAGRFRVLDQDSGEAVAGRLYRKQRADGKVFFGKTDADGHTVAVNTARQETLKVVLDGHEKFHRDHIDEEELNWWLTQ